MSLSGIRSNQGDGYQTLVAFDFALSVLCDSDFLWLEIDSTAHRVDDIVVGKSCGALICCQCKKNESDFREWSVAKLADELDKAILDLAENPTVSVRFYSRGNFRAVAKLKEFGAAYATEANYKGNLTEEHEKTDATLAKRIAAKAPQLSTHEFLRRTSSETTPDFDRMEELLRGRLRQMASNHQAAFNAIWVCLDNLGGRMDGNIPSAAAQHRLTKDDLKRILHDAGSMQVPLLSVDELRTSFARTSAIGRSWHRDISGQRIPTTVL